MDVGVRDGGHIPGHDAAARDDAPASFPIAADPARAARALLQQLAHAPSGLTPASVAAALLQHPGDWLRQSVLGELNTTWGLSGVQAVIAAEQQLVSATATTSSQAPAASSNIAPSPDAAAPARVRDAGRLDENAAPVATSPHTGAASSAAPASRHATGPASSPSTSQPMNVGPHDTSASDSTRAVGSGRETSSVAAHGGPHSSAIESALDLSRLGVAHLSTIEAVLLPGYRGAVAAMDRAAVRALALQIVGGVARIVEAQAQVVQLVPAVDTGPHAAHASTTATDPFAADPGELVALTAAKTQLDIVIATRVPGLAVQVSPQLFGEVPVAGHLEPAPQVHDVLAQLAYEAGLVVQLLEEADAIAQLVHPTDTDRGVSKRADDADRAAAVDRADRWRSRPINFLFLARVLTARGVWQALQGTTGLHGQTPAELERKVRAQAHETGATADVGSAWDADEAHALLSYGPTDWAITDEDASKVFEMLARAEPHARAELVKQLHRMGRLRSMCQQLPWGQVKALWESIDDKEASALLEPYWADKGGGKSLGKRLADQDHWYTDALNRFLDIATVGAKPRIDAAYDAREAGLISDGAYHGSVAKSVGRAGLILAAMTATGGVAGEIGAGAAEGFGIGKLGAAAMTGAAAGAGAGVGGHFVGDVYDQIADGKQGFDSISAYTATAMQGAALGGIAATVAAPVGLAAARYLPGFARTLGQDAAIANPQLARLLEAARSLGRGAAVRVRMTARELMDAIGDDGWPPGFKPAYAGAAVPARISAAPPDASVWLGIRPLADLNAPMQTQGGRGGDDLLEIESIDLGEEVEQMFGELGQAEHPEEAASRLGDDGPEVQAVTARPNKSSAGVVAESGQVATHQHHVFPEEYRVWFRERGVDIDDYCIELTPSEHQAQHGGGDWRRARDVAKNIPEAEWSAGIMDRLRQVELAKQGVTGASQARLTPEEIIKEAKSFMADRRLGGQPFRRYKKR